MAAKMRQFVVRNNNRAPVEEFINRLTSAENIRTSESVYKGVTTVTVTWNDTTPPPEYDVNVEQQADTEGSYYLTSLATDGMVYDEDEAQNIAVLNVTRKPFPTLAVESEDGTGSPDKIVVDIQKDSEFGIKATRLPLPDFSSTVETDDDTLQGDGSSSDKLRLKGVYTDATISGDGTSGSPLGVASSISVVHMKVGGGLMSGTPPSGGDYAGRYLKYAEFSGSVLTFYYDVLRFV